MTARSNSLAALTLALRVAEPDGRNLGKYVAEQREFFAPLLGVAAHVLGAADGVPDSELAPQLEALLRRRSEEVERRYRLGAEQQAVAAAFDLARTARWEEQSVHVEVDVLLGNLLADISQIYIAFFCHGVFDVVVPRMKLSEVARVLGDYNGLRAFVDNAGLHFRWNQGRGGLNLYSQLVRRPHRDRVLRVVFPPRFSVVVSERPSLTRRPGAWLAEVLYDIGLFP